MKVYLLQDKGVLIAR